MSTSKRTDAGTAPYVHLGAGFLELGPAVLPGSPARFYRGRPPALAGVPLHPSPTAGSSGAGETPLAPEVRCERIVNGTRAAGASVPAVPTRGRRPCAT